MVPSPCRVVVDDDGIVAEKIVCTHIIFYPIVQYFCGTKK